MDKGIVYILVNPCLDGWVKIGMSTRNNVAERLSELNSPANLPLSYRAYAVYEVENPQEVEKHVHSLFDIIDESLHARETLPSGKIREREFFRISPERAFDVLKTVSLLRKDSDCLRVIEPTSEQIVEGEIAAQVSRRPNFKFSMIDIGVGTELSFYYDENCTCTTRDMINKVEYEGVEYSLSGLALKLMNERGYAVSSVAGPQYFKYQGKTLNHLRNVKESRGDSE